MDSHKPSICSAECSKQAFLYLFLLAFVKLVGDNYNFLFTGYSDPSKDLRKAVKAKEKAAKKAKKEKKKKGEKAEDLFDPENLAKYRKEIEEKRKLASALSPGETRVSRAFFNTGGIYFSRAFSVDK